MDNNKKSKKYQTVTLNNNQLYYKGIETKNANIQKNPIYQIWTDSDWKTQIILKLTFYKNAAVYDEKSICIGRSVIKPINLQLKNLEFL